MAENKKKHLKGKKSVGKIDRALCRDVEAFLNEYPDGILPIVQMGDPVLRAETQSYSGQLGPLLPRLISAMKKTMRDAPGVGLAAPQIGINLAIAVAEDPNGTRDEEEDSDQEDEYVDPREITPYPFHVLINPRYEPIGSVERWFHEGCLSFNGYQAVRRRWRSVKLTYDDMMGIQHVEELVGWAARIVQHETDHLHGEVYIDKAEIRSLTDYPNLEELWYDDDVHEAAIELGFNDGTPSIDSSAK